MAAAAILDFKNFKFFNFLTALPVILEKSTEEICDGKWLFSAEHGECLRYLGPVIPPQINPPLT